MIIRNERGKVWSPKFGMLQVLSNGYLRVTSRISGYRHWLMHRAVIQILLDEAGAGLWLPIGSKIPADFDVHHQDFDKQHNCPCNLVLLDTRLHARGRKTYAQYRNRRGS